MITTVEAKQMFEDWCPYKGSPDPWVVWEAAIAAVNKKEEFPNTLYLGRTYYTNEGKEVKMISIHAVGKDYETMQDQHGVHRYSRSHSRIVGRCTGAPIDYSKNIDFVTAPNGMLK